MKYVMQVYRDSSIKLSAAEKSKIGPEIEAWVQEMNGRGVLIPGGGALARPAAARTIRVRRGEVLVTEGPLFETGEHIAGFDLLECTDLDEAIEVASRHPIARLGALELRPFLGQ